MSNPDFQGDGSNLSIEETNKLRIQLGLKPLESNDNVNSDSSASEKPKNDFVHVPAVNIGDIQEKEKFKNKLKKDEENRKLYEFLSQDRALADDEIKSNSDFLRNVLQRKQECESIKHAADNIDEDNKMIDSEPFYRSDDLSGLSIEHKASRFDTYGPTILTLKDKAILDEEDGDVLVNVNLVDEEAAERNVKNKSKGIYGSYTDSGDEDDPLTLLKPKNVLSKYDEEINGLKRDRFVLDRRGRYDMRHERMEDEMRREFFAGKSHVAISSEPRVASDYYTETEMQNLFKPKKRKARGVRTTKPNEIKTEPVKNEPVKPKKEDGELAEDEEEDYRPVLIMPDIESTTINVNLKRNLENIKKGTNKVRAEIRPIKNEETSETPNQVIITTTEEYTHSIFNILKNKRAANAEAETRVKEEPVVVPTQAPIKKIEIKEDEPVQSSGWQPEEKIMDMPSQPVKKKRNIREHMVAPQQKKKLKLTDGVLGDEVQLNSGVYSAVLLASKKGYLEENKTPKLLTNPKNQMLRAQNYQEEKIRYDDIDQKNPRRERRSLPETNFQDKIITPEIKLDYHDDYGRPQPPKEAFRSLSHRFHGKTSGKIKSEKRSKKMQEQSKITSNIGESVLNSASKMRTKMKDDNRFCVPLSGKNSIIPAAIKKSEKK